MALAARSDLGTAAAMFYLAAYACMNVGAFIVVSHISGKGETRVRIADFAGLGATPAAYRGAARHLSSLARSACRSRADSSASSISSRPRCNRNLVWLTVLGLLNSAVAAYYYLRIFAAMYMQEPSAAVTDLQPLPAATQLALIIPAIGTIVLGIFPSSILDFAIRSANFGK